MKKTVLVLFLFLFLFGCSIPSVPTETPTPEPTSEVTPIPEPTIFSKYVPHEALSVDYYVTTDAIFDGILSEKSNNYALHQMNSREDIDDFLANCCPEISEYSSVKEDPFLLLAEKYDAEFFAENTLFILYIEPACCDTEYELDHVTIENGTLTFYPYITHSGCLEAIGNFFLIVPMNNELLKGVEYFKAEVLLY